MIGSGLSSGLAVPPAPGDDAQIWRYMDFTKFVGLLEDRALFFPRIAQLDDPFEGSFPATQPLLNRLMDLLPPGAVPPGAVVNMSPGLERVGQTMREWSMVSCWHIAEYESAAMWRLYASTGAAIAIQSTVDRLRRAIGSAPALVPSIGGGTDFHIGAVEYIDYESDKIPTDSFAAQFFRKRRSFKHEHELRVLLVRYPIVEDNHMDHGRRPPDTGVAFPVDVSTLVSAVRVAPQAPAWYRDLVTKVAKRYGLSIRPTQSELDARPLY
jgi:hypothetical protein